jgi:hypothetical protein
MRYKLVQRQIVCREVTALVADEAAFDQQPGSELVLQIEVRLV